MAILRVRLRGATVADRPTLMEFYRTTETDTLPPPSIQILDNSLTRGSLLVVDDVAGASVLATAGYFDYIKSNNNHLIFELAGTRVTSAIGRLSPFPLQQILLAIRLFQIVSTEGRKDTVSVISSARHPKSIENLLVIGMVEIAEMPEWLAYDTCSWTRMSERAEWRHFIATNEAVHKMIDLLDNIEFARGKFECKSERRRKDSSTENLDIEIQFDLPLRELFPFLIAARDDGGLICNFAPLPPAWP